MKWCEGSVVWNGIKWRRVTIVVTSRRQRRTGKTIFRATCHNRNGDSYLEFRTPLALARHLTAMLSFGAVVEWPDELEGPPRSASNNIVALSKHGADDDLS